MERRSVYTWLELVAVAIVVAALLAVGLPSLQITRERARRTTCSNNLKQIGLAMRSYATANKVLPPGTICATKPIMPQNQYDVWSEAAQTGPGCHGTSFLLHILPYLPPPSSSADVYKGWDFSGGVGLNAGIQGTPGIAVTNIPEFYCPSRRSGLHRGDSTMMPDSWWPGGGTDYGGCVGRHVAYDTGTASHNVLDAGNIKAIVFYPGVSVPDVGHQVYRDGADRRWGIFGRVNVSTNYGEVRDGLSDTIMTGELQRITVADAKRGGVNNLSHDGWAVGGDATGFTTGYGGPAVQIDGRPTPLSNNGFFQSPGSDHVNGANFGLGDGSVRFISTAMSPNVFVLLGSMADRVAWACPEN